VVSEEIEMTADVLLVLMRKLSDAQRLEVLAMFHDAYCPRCGGPQPGSHARCGCWRDQSC
jgi:hypothetical protein